MENDYDKKYIEFASNIQFYEFLQEEFKDLDFDIAQYTNEIKEISDKTDWDISSLSVFLRSHPNSFDIFQQFFQLTTFTNTQLTHFLFDVDSLNSTDKEKSKKCLLKNLQNDGYFLEVFKKELKKHKIDVGNAFISGDIVTTLTENKDLLESVLWVLKSTAFKYVLDCKKKSHIIHKRLSNEQFKDVSERTAKYLIENLRLNNMLKWVKTKEFLTYKRIPIDTKTIHGRFGTIKIKQILQKHNIEDADEVFNKLKIKELSSNLNDDELQKYANKFIFVTEKSIEWVKKRNSKKPKKFDFIILYNLKPKILIETNYYSTSGTKIGINEGEYIQLNEDIKKEYPHYKFLWITDGSTWLTSTGRSKLLNLFSHFGDGILNYHLFDKNIEQLKNENNS